MQVWAAAPAAQQGCHSCRPCPARPTHPARASAAHGSASRAARGGVVGHTLLLVHIEPEALTLADLRQAIAVWSMHTPTRARAARSHRAGALATQSPPMQTPFLPGPHGPPSLGASVSGSWHSMACCGEGAAGLVSLRALLQTQPSACKLALRCSPTGGSAARRRASRRWPWVARALHRHGGQSIAVLQRANHGGLQPLGAPKTHAITQRRSRVSSFIALAPLMGILRCTGTLRWC